jgi:N6-adenosine-specific RNA methylase IME4
MFWVMESLPQNHFGAILADPPWRFEVWNNSTPVKKRGSSSTYTSAQVHYETMSMDDLISLPVKNLSASDCVLFLWVTWPLLLGGIKIIEQWGFTYKTCAFAWMKANNKQLDMFNEELEADMRLGYWTRANSEVCLLATKGKPKRLNADVRQGIIAPRREHSRKPDGIHQRIERLIAGPYLELFARQERPGWTVWGNETDKFTPWDAMWQRPFGRPELVWGDGDREGQNS